MLSPSIMCLIESDGLIIPTQKSTTVAKASMNSSDPSTPTIKDSLFILALIIAIITTPKCPVNHRTIKFTYSDPLQLLAAEQVVEKLVRVLPAE